MIQITKIGVVAIAIALLVAFMAVAGSQYTLMQAVKNQPQVVVTKIVVQSPTPVATVIPTVMPKTAVRTVITQPLTK